MASKPPLVGSLLFRSLRAYQIYGANTEVGKTIFSTLLCKAARKQWPGENAAFLKPVSTGPLEEADDSHVRRFAPDVDQKTLYQFDLPVSPHIAARLSSQQTPSDELLLSGIQTHASHRAALGPGWLFVETAGGVHSPGPSGSTQADLYSPLRLPVVLVGDSKLGGISQTISAFESLKIRGYDVEAVLMFREDKYQNHEYLTKYFREHHDIHVGTNREPPSRVQDLASDTANMRAYYEAASTSPSITAIISHLNARHNERISRLESMSTTAHKTIFYPFTQHKHLTPDRITVIDSAHGDNFQTVIPSPSPSSSPSSSSPTALLQPSFDASASWWTQGLGHGNPSLALAAAYAAGRYGHVMFAEAIHEPALALAELVLSNMGNRRLTRVFYSDNGSTGAEVAVKMALRAARLRYGWEKDEGQLGVLGLRGSYHGDTMGAMDCAEPGTFNEKVEWYRGRGFWLEYPTVLCKKGKWVVEFPNAIGEGKIEFEGLGEVFDVEAREKRGDGVVYERFITDALVRLRSEGRRFGALMIEPVVLGAGGMLLVDPLFQRTLVNVVRNSAHLYSDEDNSMPQEDTNNKTTWTGLPVIFDEVFTGLYRLGRFSAASFLGVDADISVHAKLLTGGLVPLCATLASESIFRAFESDDKSDALLHGHSYTAHAVGCQLALQSVRELSRMDASGEWDWAKPASSREDEQQQQSASVTLDGPASPWSVWGLEFVDWLSRQEASQVGGVWALGSVLAIHMSAEDGAAGYKSNAARGLQGALLRGWEGEGNVHSRVLGNVLYLMTGQKTEEESVRRLERVIRQALVESAR
ncbi:pyridoxal phosphate-dependent transferase [Coniochaeta sp. 2T2.1]|nr:pyridoxal phosphate-dependent transferase [Coniochaeta sp. 2T2.1]